MINAIAVDDEPLALQVIHAHAVRIPFLNLQETFTDPFRALDYASERAIDLVFLDIDMPDLSGLTFIKTIRKNGVRVIFTTAHPQYAVESYEVEAVDYLLKPFGFPRFLEAVNKVRERLGNQQPAPAFFFVNTGRECHRVRYDQIRYLEASGNYVLYHLADRQLMVRTTIKDALAQLPTAGLVRIRRSYAVALTWIDKVQDNHVYVGSARLSIGPTYREPFWARLAALSQD